MVCWFLFVFVLMSGFEFVFESESVFEFVLVSGFEFESELVSVF